jgi:hypothetical protein
MAKIKRCNHCQSIDGQGMELIVGEIATCANCGCIWHLNGYHVLVGQIKGEKCAYPQPQHWSSDPILQLQQGKSGS